MGREGPSALRRASPWQQMPHRKDKLYFQSLWGGGVYRAKTQEDLLKDHMSLHEVCKTTCQAPFEDSESHTLLILVIPSDFKSETTRSLNEPVFSVLSCKG